MLKPILLALVLLILTAPAVYAAEFTGRVTWIYDGDTIEVESLGRVRLLGIDTPEYQDSPRDRFYQKNFALAPSKLREIAQRAKAFVIARAKGQNVRIETDQQQHDKHDRVLAYVYLPDEGKMLNRLLLEQGLASVYRRYDFRYKKDFLSAEKLARKTGRGLWSND